MDDLSHRFEGYVLDDDHPGVGNERPTLLRHFFQILLETHCVVEKQGIQSAPIEFHENVAQITAVLSLVGILLGEFPSESQFRKPFASRHYRCALSLDPERLEFDAMDKLLIPFRASHGSYRNRLEVCIPLASLHDLEFIRDRFHPSCPTESSQICWVGLERKSMGRLDQTIASNFDFTRFDFQATSAPDRGRLLSDR